MTKDEHLAVQEEQYRNDVAESIANDTAVLIQEGYSEREALARATTINENQQAALDDPTGVLETLDESQSPVPPAGKERQTYAISKRILKKINE